MATLNELTIEVERRVQLDRFEPVEYGVTGLFVLEPDDDPNEVYDAGAEALTGMVERGLARRVAIHQYAELGPSVPKVKAVLRDHAGSTLDEAAITAIAESIVAADDDE
jgi:hypothetical protein